MRQPLFKFVVSQKGFAVQNTEEILGIRIPLAIITVTASRDYVAVSIVSTWPRNNMLDDIIVYIERTQAVKALLSFAL